MQIKRERRRRKNICILSRVLKYNVSIRWTVYLELVDDIILNPETWSFQILCSNDYIYGLELSTAEFQSMHVLIQILFCILVIIESEIHQ